MKSLLLRFVFIASLTLSATLRGALPFPQESSDLKPDPAVRFGTLPNGFRYVLMHNNEPKARASLRLLVNAGSFNEKDEQRGLAHFLEHMAFNGSTHYAPGTLVEFFQRMGMSFGGDTNAATSFDHTVYQLELPNTAPATLSEGLRVFTDYAGGLMLQPAEIDKERGIILSEKRTRDSVGYRTLIAQFDFAFGDTLLPKRLPIGQAEIIEKSQRPLFADFYDAWYRPELMSVIAVGDFDPAALEKEITVAFSELKARGPVRPAPDRGTIKEINGIRAFYHGEVEAPSTEVSISSLKSYQHIPDTSAYRLSQLPRDLATAMITRRLSILAKKENAPFSSGHSSVSENYDIVREASIDISCKAEQWQDALAVADQELRRALQYGFAPAELKEIVANQINALEQAVKTAPTRHSPALADDLAQSLVDREVFTTPADDLALFKPAFEKITVEDCLAALRASWAAPGRYVSVTGNAKIDGDATAAITAAYEKTHALAVTAPAAEATVAWGYTDFGPAGTVVKKAQVEDLDLTLVTFSNGVRLNLKKTDFEVGRIRISARVGPGQLTEPPSQPGLATYARATFTAGGLGKHSSDDLRRILAGKTVGAGFGIGGDSLVFTGATNRDDLALELQLITAQITDPGYRPEAARQAAKAIEQLYLSLAHTPGGPLTLEVPRLLANGDPRFGLPSQAVMSSRTLAETKAWLTPQLATGAIEISIVGDIDLDSTIAAVAQTFGALPTRAPRLALDELRHVTFPAQAFSKDYTVDTEIPKGTVAVFWPSTDALEIHRTRRMNMLASVLMDRLRVKVREELGAGYSPSAGSNPSDIYPGYGFLIANITVDPAKAKEISDVTVAVAGDMAEKGVTVDELDRAKQPALTAVRESLRNNGYWMTVLSRAQEKPETLDWSRGRVADIEAIKPEELSALAKQYFTSAKAFRVIVQPPEKSSAMEKSSAAPIPAAPDKK